MHAIFCCPSTQGKPLFSARIDDLHHPTNGATEIFSAVVARRCLTMTNGIRGAFHNEHSIIAGIHREIHLSCPNDRKLRGRSQSRRPRRLCRLAIPLRSQSPKRRKLYSLCCHSIPNLEQ